MVTHNATVLEQHLLLAGETPTTPARSPPAAAPQRSSPAAAHAHAHHGAGAGAPAREDPMSHRIIEKRRRDRMNNCLADLSRLIPAEYLKKGRGRIEKTEIIEMAIRHMKHLQAHACRHADQCDLAQQQQQQQRSPEEAAAEPPGAGGGGGGGGAGGGNGGSGGGGAASAGAPGGPIVLEHYRLGYQECLSEAMHFMVEVEGFFAGDPLCVQLINHLQRHCERILKGDRLNFPRTHLGETTSSSGSSCGSGRGRPAGGGGGGGSGGGGGGLGSSGLGSASASASGSGSSPGSCSDSGRAEPHDSGVGGGGGSAGRRGALAPLGLALAARHDDCYEEGAPAPAPAPPLGSQLRDMLTNAPADWRRHGDLLMFSLAAAGTGGLAPHPATLGVTSVIHNGSAPPLPQQHQLPPASPGHAPDGAPGPLYKFKNNIKQRFSAEHHHSGAGGPLGAGGAPYGAPKRRRYASETEDGPGAAGGNLLSLSLHRRDSETCSVPSPPASPPPLAQQPPAPARSPLLPSPASSPPPVKFSLAGAQPPPPAAAHGPPAPPARPVPIFALHSRGAYYVPLTLDADALAPYLAECGCACACGCEGAEAHGPCAPPVALHPVTISVNFSRAPAPSPAPASAPAPCARPAARHLGACGAPAAMVAPAPGLPWKAEPAPWKAEPGAFASPRWPEALPERG